MTELYKLPEVPRRAPARTDAPIPDIYHVIDNDLARDNIEKDIPAADREDL